MITNLLVPFVALTASLSATYVPSASMSAPIPQPVVEVQYYTVKENDTLSSIATDLYGSEDFWTVLWSDNDSLEMPESLEVGMRLKLRSGSLKKEDLKDFLQKKIVAPVATPVEVINISQIPQVVAQTIAFQPSGAIVLAPEQIAFLGQCESGMTATRNSGNGYYGAFQFSPATWRSMNTGYERADLAPLEVQIDAVQRLLQRSSIFTQFPGCARKMQSLGMI